MKKMWLILALCGALAGMTGCVTTVERTDVTFDDHPSGAAKEVREVAGETWLFAQLASNSYGTQDSLFKTPDWVRPVTEVAKGSAGFQSQVFRVEPTGKPAYLVIAYTGTNSVSDIFTGTLNPFQPQQRQGLKLLRDMRQKHPGMPIVVVGHSLGGAIAKYVATREDGVYAHVFNPSGIATSGPYRDPEKVNAVSQYGEVLKALRFITPDGSKIHTTLGCKKSNPVGRHSIRPLAECLTHVAAWTDADAERSLEANGLGPKKRLVDNVLTL